MEPSSARGSSQATPRAASRSMVRSRPRVEEHRRDSAVRSWRRTRWFLIAGAAAASLAFVVAAFQVSRHPTGVDREIEAALEGRSFALPFIVPMQLLEVASSARASFALGVVVGTFFAFRKADWRPGLLMMLAFIGVLALADILKTAFGRAAPSDWASGDLSGSSFPSGHVAQAVAVWGTVAVIVALQVSGRRRIAVAVCAVALIGGAALSRLVLGAHWATDVVGGIGLGGLWLALITAVAIGMPSLGRRSTAGQAGQGDHVT